MAKELNLIKCAFYSERKGETGVMNIILQQRLCGLVMIILSVIGFKIIGTEDCGAFIVAALLGVVLLFCKNQIID